MSAPAPPLPPLALSRSGVAPFWEIIFRPSSRCTLHSEITAAAAVPAVSNPDQKTGPVAFCSGILSLDGHMDGGGRVEKVNAAASRGHNGDPVAATFPARVYLGSGRLLRRSFVVGIRQDRLLLLPPSPASARTCTICHSAAR